VAPTSTVHQLVSEIEKWTPRLCASAGVTPKLCMRLDERAGEIPWLTWTSAETSWDASASRTPAVAQAPTRAGSHSTPATGRTTMASATTRSPAITAPGCEKALPAVKDADRAVTVETALKRSQLGKKAAAARKAAAVVRTARG
jgi:hypothetical protein